MRHSPALPRLPLICLLQAILAFPTGVISKQNNHYLTLLNGRNIPEYGKPLRIIFLIGVAEQFICMAYLVLRGKNGNVYIIRYHSVASFLVKPLVKVKSPLFCRSLVNHALPFYCRPTVPRSRDHRTSSNIHLDCIRDFNPHRDRRRKHIHLPDPPFILLPKRRYQPADSNNNSAHQLRQEAP